MLSTYLTPGLSAKEIAERLVKHGYERHTVHDDDDGSTREIEVEHVALDGVNAADFAATRRFVADLIEHIRSER